ncbi:TRAP transporter large permease [uncultured Sneathiella sp.]|uniref:TRAP transporter large permease n=1 Tax=uncultured Sneathiella sp. TaxID=879315 RepID=UPI0030ED981F|tara:strand:- start:14453 stop:15763 length:1311 start_codon:yes stop_codon:yes gene_type:complete
MSDLVVGFAGIGLGLILMAIGTPIGPALGLAAFLGIAIITGLGAALGTLASAPYTFVGDWNLTAVPMFLLMGYVASNTGLSRGLFKACRMLLSRLPGGLAIASIGATSLLSAASGSSMATASAMAKIATPEMLRYKYDRGLATAVIASAGTLGSLIPPSILLILYGFFAGAPVGQLFMAGVIPGIITALLYAGMVVFGCILNPNLAPAHEETREPGDVIEAIRDVWPLPVLIIGVLAGISGGIFSPTEAGAVGAALAVLIAWTRGGLTFPRLWESVFQTLCGTASVFIIVIATVLLARFMALSGVPTFLTGIVLSGATSTFEIILVIAILYLVLGCFIDSIGLLLLTLPIILPMAQQANMDLVWFGIVIVKLLEMGMVTPPVGLNVYVINAALNNTIPLSLIFKGVMWFLVMDVIALLIFVVFPEVVLWLPNLLAN